MAKINFGIKGEGVENQGFSRYDGPVPPAGAYRGVVKRLQVVEKNSKGNPMLKGLVEFKAEKGDKKNAKYDGFGAWFNIVIMDKTAGMVNGFLAALTDGSPGKIKAIEKAFWNEGPDVDAKNDNHVRKIGKVAVKSPDGELVVRVFGKQREYQGNTQFAIKSWIVPDGPKSDEQEDLDDDIDDDLDDDIDDDLDDDIDDDPEDDGGLFDLDDEDDEDDE